MPISSTDSMLSHYGMLPPMPPSSALSAKALPPVQESAPIESKGGRYEMSEWAKLIIIWSLMKSMSQELKLDNIAKPLVPPDGAGLVYGSKGEMQFGPSPAGQQLAGNAPAAISSEMTHLGLGSGAAPTAGVGGGMAGAFVNVSV